MTVPYGLLCVCSIRKLPQPYVPHQTAEISFFLARQTVLLTDTNSEMCAERISGRREQSSILHIGSALDRDAFGLV